MNEKLVYNPRFALVICGHVAEEDLTEEQLFNSISRFYEPEFSEFEIEVWDTSGFPGVSPRWNRV